MEFNNEPACRDNVSDFEGPGMMLGWYLTLLGCIVSWTLHPKRKHEDSIDVNTLAFLTLPTLAAAQVIYQSYEIAKRSIRLCGSNIILKKPLAEDYTRLCVCQQRFAIEAPAKVVSIFLNTAVMLYAIPAIRRPKRGSLTAIIFVLCFGSYLYMYEWALFYVPSITDPSDFFKHKYGFAAICHTIIGNDIVRLVIWRFSSRRAKRREQLEHQTTSETQMPEASQVDFMPPWLIRFGLCLWAIAGYLLQYTPLSWLAFHNTRFWEVDWMSIFFPETPYSLGDVKQVVAVATGGLVLLFNVWSTAKMLYLERKGRRQHKNATRLLNEKRDVTSLLEEKNNIKAAPDQKETTSTSSLPEREEAAACS